MSSRSTYSSEEILKELQKNQPKHGRKRTQSNLTYESDSVNDDDDYSSYYDSDLVSDKDNDESSDDNNYNSSYDDYSIYDEDSDVDNDLTEENKNYIKETIAIIKNKIPEEILGVNVYDDQMTFIIKFQGDDEDNKGEKIQVRVAKKLWPKIVIDFFEKHLVFI